MINCFCFVLISVLKTALSADDYYVAAVVEMPSTFVNVMKGEKRGPPIQEYIKLINSIDTELDIIVFPEAILDDGGPTPVPAPSTDYLLCNSTSSKYKDYLKELSCAALNKKVTVVVNVLELVNCKNPPPDEHCTRHNEKLQSVVHNTDVVFDQNGQVVARYRKWNLAGEDTLSILRSPEVVTFETKNGDTFGIFTCFDILFGTPALNLSKNLHVKSIVYPTYWFSDLPYLTALSTQQMWAQENNVTLLSAGGNSYNTGTGGSGIFLGEKGALVQMIIPSSGNAKMLLQKVPRSPSSDGVIVNNIDPDEVIDSLAAEMDDFKLNIDPTVYEHTSVPLNLNKTTVIEEICHGESACCKFTINFTVNSELMNLGKNTYTYHIAVFNGVRKFPGVRDVGVESCGIIACLNYSSTSCGQRFPKYSNVTWPITFNSIKVVGSFTNVEHKIQYPSSVLSSLRAISPLKTSWKKEVKVNMVERTHALVKPQSRILTFGIFGRDFSKDDAPHSYSSADLARFAGILLAIAMASFVKTF